MVRHSNRAFGSFRIASTAYQIMAHIEQQFKRQTQDCTANAHKPHQAEAARATKVPVHSLLTLRGGEPPQVASYIALLHTTGLSKCLFSAPAILRETSEETSYKAVR